MSVGIDYDWSCSSNVDRSEIIEVDNDQINDTLREMYTVSENLDTNTTVFLKEYPCEWGFHYLTSGAAVWLAFLPFYITQLLGNCWRQCCCCLCDPLVMKLKYLPYARHYSPQIVYFEPNYCWPKNVCLRGFFS